MSHHSGFQVIAHRGASGTELENTLEAFSSAKELGSDWVEMDVRQTSDSVLVIHHDAYLPDAHNQSIALTHSQDLPSNVPTLAEALEVCDGIGVVVEIKNDPSEPGYDSQNQISVAVAGTLTAYTQKQMVISFNLESINRIKSVDPQMPTGFLVFDPMMAAQSVEIAVGAGHSLISFHTSNVTPSLVKQAHDAGLQVHTWTANEADLMRRLISAGVDGIVTDYPEIAIKLRTELEHDGLPAGAAE